MNRREALTLGGSAAVGLVAGETLVAEGGVGGNDSTVQSGGGMPWPDPLMQESYDQRLQRQIDELGVEIKAMMAKRLALQNIQGERRLALVTEDDISRALNQTYERTTIPDEIIAGGICHDTVMDALKMLPDAQFMIFNHQTKLDLFKLTWPKDITAEAFLVWNMPCYIHGRVGTNIMILCRKDALGITTRIISFM